jgi:hypothetical protein
VPCPGNGKDAQTSFGPRVLLSGTSSRGASIRTVVFTVIFIHVVGFACLLLHGSKMVEANATSGVWALEDVGYPQLGSADSLARNLGEGANMPMLAAPTPMQAESTAAYKEYIVARGDTLSRIAKAHQIPLDILISANPAVDPLRLRLGQKIQIPVQLATETSSGHSRELLSAGL